MKRIGICLTICLALALMPALGIAEEYGFDAKYGTLSEYRGPGGELVLPGNVGGQPVVNLGQALFDQNRDITKVVLPEGIKRIGINVFYFCENLQEISPPEGITVLSERVPSQNIWLTDVMLPASLARIESGAFRGSSYLDYLVFAGNSLPEITPDAFEGVDKLADVDIGHRASKLEKDAARAQLEALGIHCNVWRANEPDMAPYPGSAVTQDPDTGLLNRFDHSITQMGSYWRYAHGDETVDVTGIAEGLFKDSALTRFDLPRSNKFTVIGKSAFENRALSDIRLFERSTLAAMLLDYVLQ